MDRYEPTYLSKDEAFDCAGSARRRLIVAVLLERRGSWEVTELAREVAAREQGGPPRRVDEGTLRRVRTALDHQELPKLVNYDVVRYDRESGTVDAGPAIDDLAPLV